MKKIFFAIFILIFSYIILQAKEYNFKYLNINIPDNIKFSGKYDLSDKNDIQLNYRWDSKEIVINIDITNNNNITDMPLKIWAKIQQNILKKKLDAIVKGVKIEKKSEINNYKHLDNYLYQILKVGKSGYYKDVLILYIKENNLFYELIFIYNEDKKENIDKILSSIKI